MSREAAKLQILSTTAGKVLEVWLSNHYCAETGKLVPTGPRRVPAIKDCKDRVWYQNREFGPGRREEAQNEAVRILRRNFVDVALGPRITRGRNGRPVLGQESGEAIFLRPRENC